MARGPIDDVLDYVRSQKADTVYARVVGPQDKTEFGYGWISGYAAALENLEKAVESALEKEKRRV